MKPVVIIEGPDGAGKTTMAQALRRKLDAVYVHHGSYQTLRGDQIARLYHQSLEPALTSSAAVVLDRSWLSEPIYGEVFRSGLDRTAAYRRMLDRCLLSVPHVVVYLTTDLETLWRTVGGRPSVEMAKRREQLERVLAGYERSAPTWSGRVTRMERAGRTAEVLADAVADMLPHFGPLSREARLHDDLGVIGNVCGLPTRRVLLVGDSASRSATTALPFVNHNLGGCSAWFAEYLERAGIAEDRLLWVNAWRADDTPTDLGLLHHELLPVKTFALGHIAARALLEASVPHVQVEHPQFIKRFRFDRVSEWPLAAEIKEALQ